MRIAELAVKGIVIMSATILGNMGWTCIMSSWYSIGLVIVFAASIIMAAFDPISNWIMGAFGTEHQI